MTPGHINLIEETTGKGHTTRVLAGEESSDNRPIPLIARR